MMLRLLLCHQAADVNHLLRVPGIVISAARAKPKATSISIQCKQCNTVKHLPCHSAFGSVTLPRTCDWWVLLLAEMLLLLFAVADFRVYYRCLRHSPALCPRDNCVVCVFAWTGP